MSNNFYSTDVETRASKLKLKKPGLVKKQSVIPEFPVNSPTSNIFSKD